MTSLRHQPNPLTDAEQGPAGVDLSDPQPKITAVAKNLTVVGSDTLSDTPPKAYTDATGTSVGVSDSSTNHIHIKSDSPVENGVVGGNISDQTPTTKSYASDVSVSGSDVLSDTTPTGSASASLRSVFVSLRFYAELLDDIEGQRKRQANRLRALQDTERGYALPDWHPTVTASNWYLDDTVAMEKRAVKDLNATFKMLDDTVVAYVTGTRGLGIKSVARFLGTTGDPSWHYREERPRKLRELYSYCGLGVTNGEAPRNKRGQQSNWNNRARMRAYNMIEPCIKAGGPYREIYDEAKARYQVRPDLKEESKAHVNNMAKRVGMKAIVSDLHGLFSALREQFSEFEL